MKCGWLATHIRTLGVVEPLPKPLTVDPQGAPIDCLTLILNDDKLIGISPESLLYDKFNGLGVRKYPRLAGMLLKSEFLKRFRTIKEIHKLNETSINPKKHVTI
jgi:hypothetical protein